MNIKVVRETFAAIAPYMDEVLTHFYETLFTKFPESKLLFENTDLGQQRKSLGNSLHHILEQWENNEQLRLFLLQLGARHAEYGIEPHHFDWAGKSLIETLKYFFDNSWTPQVESDWIELYRFISLNMIEGLKQAQSLDIDSEQKRSGPNLAMIEESVLHSSALEDIVREHARDLLQRALAEESILFANQLAREKMREILKTALKHEVDEVRQNLKRKKSA